MPLPLTVSCFSKIQIGFSFLVPAHSGSPGQRAVKRVCMCVSALERKVALCRRQCWDPRGRGRNLLSTVVLLFVIQWSYVVQEYRVTHSVLIVYTHGTKVTLCGRQQCSGRGWNLLSTVVLMAVLYSKAVDSFFLPDFSLLPLFELRVQCGDCYAISKVCCLLLFCVGWQRCRWCSGVASLNEPAPHPTPPPRLLIWGEWRSVGDSAGTAANREPAGRSRRAAGTPKVVQPRRPPRQGTVCLSYSPGGATGDEGGWRGGWWLSSEPWAYRLTPTCSWYSETSSPKYRLSFVFIRKRH